MSAAPPRLSAPAAESDAGVQGAQGVAPAFNFPAPLQSEAPRRETARGEPGLLADSLFRNEADQDVTRTRSRSELGRRWLARVIGVVDNLQTAGIKAVDAFPLAATA